jgi:isochorismate pyruvate lyase
MASDEQFLTMAEVRAEIDRIDAEMVALLVRRAGCIDNAIAVKTRMALPARIESRVTQVLGRVRQAGAARGLEPEFIESLWRTIIEWSIAREERALEEVEEQGSGC